MCYAHGASAYTQTDDCPTRPLEESGLLVSDCGPPPVRTWSQLIDDLLTLRDLEEDWDCQGAAAPHPAVVDGSITLAQHFQAKKIVPADRVIAGVSGTVFFEWHSSGGYLEIEVTTPDQAECRSVKQGTGVTEVIILSRRS
jgi:hypothetical protein